MASNRKIVGPTNSHAIALSDKPLTFRARVCCAFLAVFSEESTDMLKRS